MADTYNDLFDTPDVDPRDIIVDAAPVNEETLEDDSISLPNESDIDNEDTEAPIPDEDNQADNDSEPESPVDDQVADNTDASVSLPNTDTDELYKVKANGREFDLTLDELKNLASKGLDYTHKTTKLKPYRKMVDAIETNNVSENDINLLIDIKQGNKEALARLMKENSIESYDLPEDSQSYTPKEYGRDEENINFTNTVNKIKSVDESSFNKINMFYSNMDKTSREHIYANPQYLEYLQQDILEGRYEAILQEADKLYALDSDNNKLPIFEYYVRANNKLAERFKAQEATQQRHSKTLEQDRQERIQKASIPRTSPTPPKGKRQLTMDDMFSEVSDKEHSEWIRRNGLEHQIY